MRAKLDLNEQGQVVFQLVDVDFNEFVDIVAAMTESVNAAKSVERKKQLQKRFYPAFKLMELALENHRDKYPAGKDWDMLKRASATASVYHYLQDLKHHNRAREAEINKP